VDRSESVKDEEIWKRRFAVFALFRLAGLAFFLFGVAIAFSDIVRPGGWPLLGGLMAITGALAAVLVPRALKRSWDGK
jgi:hypothetical protein